MSEINIGKVASSLSEEIDFREYYNLENYLFNTVNKRFITDKYINAADFFCIVIWKANRSKSKVAKRLLFLGYKNLDEAVKAITSCLFELNTPKERLQYLMHECGFRLPLSSAILSVLFPDEFTIYDIRVCEVLKLAGYDFDSLTYKKYSEDLWEQYNMYKVSVTNLTPKEWSLREKDKYLWGKSFFYQLEDDLKNSFHI